MELITKKQLSSTDTHLINRPYQLDVLLSIFKHSKCFVELVNLVLLPILYF
jgi:hypothetical protein